MEFTPGSSGRKKPITKAQLRAMRAQYAEADKIAAEVLEKEKKEKERLAAEIEDTLKDTFL